MDSIYISDIIKLIKKHQTEAIKELISDRRISVEIFNNFNILILILQEKLFEFFKYIVKLSAMSTNISEEIRRTYIVPVFIIENGYTELFEFIVEFFKFNSDDFLEDNGILLCSAYNSKNIDIFRYIVNEIKNLDVVLNYIFHHEFIFEMFASILYENKINLCHFNMIIHRCIFSEKLEVIENLYELKDSKEIKVLDCEENCTSPFCKENVVEEIFIKRCIEIKNEEVLSFFCKSKTEKEIQYEFHRMRNKNNYCDCFGCSLYLKELRRENYILNLSLTDEQIYDIHKKEIDNCFCEICILFSKSNEIQKEIEEHKKRLELAKQKLTENAKNFEIKKEIKEVEYNYDDHNFKGRCNCKNCLEYRVNCLSNSKSSSEIPKVKIVNSSVPSSENYVYRKK